MDVCSRYMKKRGTVAARRHRRTAEAFMLTSFTDAPSNKVKITIGEGLMPLTFVTR